MKHKNHIGLKLIVVVLFVGVIFTQMTLDPQIREIHKGEKTAFQGLTNEFILGPMLGLQQAVAGLLWVRADEFFHEGDYDAILPIVRMVTWLDPHQLDVYITGAWHLSYNFTDSNERSDRRYIPAAQMLLEEGDKNNSNIYDIAFELGWQNNDKIKDYDKSEYWFKQASERKAAPTGGEANEPAPMHVRHMLAHALERQGRVDDANKVWAACIVEMDAKLKLAPNEFTLRSLHDSEVHNLRLNKIRKYSRYVHRINFDVDAKKTTSYDEVTGAPIPADAYLSVDPEKDNAPIGQPRPAAVAVKWDSTFDTFRRGKTTISFPEPKVMDLKGTFNMGDGSRVLVRLHDDNWHEAILQNFTFDINADQTIMQDSLSVRNAEWGRKIDMSKDPKMYSFKRDFYYLVLNFDPRSTSPFIQDRIGWSGEGMAEPKHLMTVKSNRPGIKDDDFVIQKVYKLSRQQIMGAVPVTEADVVSNEDYARAMAANDAAMKKNQ